MTASISDEFWSALPDLDVSQTDRRSLSYSIFEQVSHLGIAVRKYRSPEIRTVDVVPAERRMPDIAPTVWVQRESAKRESAKRSRERRLSRISELEKLHGTHNLSRAKKDLLMDTALLRFGDLVPVDTYAPARRRLPAAEFKTSQEKRRTNRESARKSRIRKRAWLMALESGLCYNT